MNIYLRLYFPVFFPIKSTLSLWQINPGFPELLSEKQTNKQTNRKAEITSLYDYINIVKTFDFNIDF